MKFFLIAIATGMIGCAQKQMVAPSGAGVTSGLGRVTSNVADAKRYNDLAVIHNQNATTRIERIEAKSKVIQQFWGK